MRVFDEDESKKLNAEQWMLDLIKLNPSYVHWGPHEDYMWKDGEAWDSSISNATWEEFGPWSLDCYNECVNFYFSVVRSSQECNQCKGNGYHPDGQYIVNSFYAHMNPKGEHWNDAITQDELDALVEARRVKPEVTLDEINADNRPGARGMGHDGINRHILTLARLKRHGIPEYCPSCEGDGTVFTEPAAHVSLTLWMLHPRKGCSRGVAIDTIKQSDLPAIFAWLKQAAERNADRFGRIK